MYTQIKRLPKQDKPSTNTNGGNGTKPPPSNFPMLDTLFSGLSIQYGTDANGEPTATVVKQNNIFSAVGDVGNSVSDASNSIGDFTKKLSDGTTWLNVGGVLFGSVLVFFGIQSLLKAELIKTAKSVTGV